jgi:hypothetical protein
MESEICQNLLSLAPQFFVNCDEEGTVLFGEAGVV